MKKIENTALQMIAEASRCPDYGPDMVKSLMKKLDMNEKGFALLMNALRDISKKFPELIKDELNNWKLESKEINQVYKLASKLIN